jgi:hypothetical protein
MLATRILMPMVVAVTAAAVLFHAGPQQAFACTCAPLPDNPVRAREYLESSDVLVLAEVVERTANEPYPAARVRVEHAYSGDVGSEISVRSANCNGIIVDFKRGQRWLMTLDQRDGGWQAHGCSAGLVDGAITSRYNDGDVWLAAINEIAPPPADNMSIDPSAAASIGHEDGASTTAIGLAIAALTSVMLASVWLAQRRMGGTVTSD